MTVGWWGVLAVLAVWGFVVLWRDRREARERGGTEAWQQAGDRTADPDDGIDYDTLRQAEEEVKDLGTDVKGRALEDQAGDDWGPGTPKPPYT